MSDEIQRIIGDLLARVNALEKAVEENRGWIKRAIMALLGAGGGIAYAYARSLGLF